MLLDKLKQEIQAWRSSDYFGIKPETKNIFNYIKQTSFLHKPQLEAFETYIYLKEIKQNRPLVEIFKGFYTDDKELLTDGLGISKNKAFDYIGNNDLIDSLIKERFNETDYTSQIYALTMGAGKTLLMGVMMIYDFILSYKYPNDSRFAKNVLIFAPDKTIIESLKEIKDFDYLKVFPEEYTEVFLNVY